MSRSKHKLLYFCYREIGDYHEIHQGATRYLVKILERRGLNVQAWFWGAVGWEEVNNVSKLNALKKCVEGREYKNEHQ